MGSSMESNSIPIFYRFLSVFLGILLLGGVGFNQCAFAMSTTVDSTNTYQTNSHIRLINSENTEDETYLPEEETPLASLSLIPHWALGNLITLVITLLIAMASVVLFMHSRKKEERCAGVADGSLSAHARRRQLAFMLASLISAITSVVIFICTEDMGNKMTLVDEWTLLMVVTAVFSAVATMLVFAVDGKINEGSYEQDRPAHAPTQC